MKLFHNNKVKQFSKLLLYWNVFLLVAAYFVLPAFKRSQGFEILESTDYFRIALIVLDLLLVYVIYKGNLWNIWLIGLSSLAFILINVMVLTSTVNLGFVFFCCLHLLDFVLLLFFARNEGD